MYTSTNGTIDFGGGIIEMCVLLNICTYLSVRTTFRGWKTRKILHISVT